MPGGMVVRELFTTLGLDVNAAQFAEGQLAVEAIKTALNWMVEAAKHGLEALEELVVGTAEARHEIGEMSVRTGVSTDALQKLAYAAKFSNVSMDELGQAMNLMAKKGVHDVEGEMLRLADRLHKMPADGRRAELAMTVMGRAGGRMVPLLARGREELEKLFEDAPVASKEAIESATHFTETLIALQVAGKSTWKALADPLIEALNPILDDLRAWQKENQKVIKQKLREWATAVGKAITFLWGGVKKLRDALLFLAKNLDWVAIVLGGPLLAALILNASAVWALVAGYVAAGAAAIASAASAVVAWIAAAAPIIGLGLVVAALILLFEDLYYFFTGEKESAIGDFFKTIGGGLKTAFMDAWTEISFFFRSSIETFKSIFVNGFDGTFASLKTIAIRWVEWLLGTVANAMKLVVKLLPGGESILSGLASLTGSKALDPNVDVAARLMGGGASPAAAQAAAAGTGTGPTVQTTVQAPITINATPGMDPHAIAGAVREQIRDELKTQHEEAKAAVGR